jgi:putative endonuclease
MGLVQSIAAVLRRSARSFPAEFKTPRERGEHGEKFAARHLRSRGYRVLYRNYRVTRGEIDLVCRDGDVLAFVEVKTRQDERFGHPSEAVDFRKQRRISRAADAYLKELGNPEISYRFDIVEVLCRPGSAEPECRLIQDAHGKL